jgi:hypothetical protein
MNVSTADLRNYWTEFHETWWSYPSSNTWVFRHPITSDKNLWFQNISVN